MLPVAFQASRTKQNLGLGLGLGTLLFALTTLSWADIPRQPLKHQNDAQSRTQSQSQHHTQHHTAQIDKQAIVDNAMAIASASHRDTLQAQQQLCPLGKALAANVAGTKKQARQAWNNGRRHFAQAQVFAALDPQLQQLHRAIDGTEGNLARLEDSLWGNFKAEEFALNCQSLADNLKQAIARIENRQLAALGDSADQAVQGLVKQLGRFAWQTMVHRSIGPAQQEANIKLAPDHISDSSHWRFYYQAQGLKNLYQGQYLGINEALISGTSLKHLAEYSEPSIAPAMNAAIDDMQWASLRLSAAAEDKYAPLKVSAMVSGNRYGETLLANLSASLKRLSEASEQYRRALDQ